jgi:hypothetical protein
MAGKQKDGIDYFPVESDHVFNKKIRLLLNEFEAEGYWIWNCLLCKIYKEKGYYMDMANQDELELFAIDVCKRKVSLVKEVIYGCVRRGLFDQTVFDAFDLLTSDRIQLNYLHATTERRKKGTVVAMINEVLLVEPDESWKNVSVLGIKAIIPGKNAKVPGKDLQSKQKVKYSNRRKLGADAPPVTKHWDSIVEQWFLFNQEKFQEKPSFAGADPRHLKKILELLEKRAVGKGVEWTPENALKRFKEFLTNAYRDPWLSKNFLLRHLENFIDKIILNQNKGNGGTNGSHNKASAGGKSAGANQLLESLKTDLGING